MNAFHRFVLGGSAAVALLAPAIARADVRPANLFGDHMVLQQTSIAPVWGTARAGEKVTVSIAGRTAQTVTGADGKWIARLAGLKAGGPYTLTIKGDTTVTISDVLIGDVWLASGQSNMDFTVAKTEKKYFAGVQNEAEEIAQANYPQIRYFTVDLKMTTNPQADVTGHWAVVSPETVGDMSAVAYFFARDLYKRKRFPFGVIVSTWGASTAEAWTSRDALNAAPDLQPFISAFDAKVAAYTPDVQQKNAQAQKAWAEAAEAAKTAGAKPPRAPKNLDPVQDQHNATVLYNGMIFPVKPYGIRGFLWYQGESNGLSADKYARLMQTLIQSWRADWNAPGLPFLFVQLANINKPQTEPVASVKGTVAVRDAQRETLRISDTAMASAIDIGDADNVHPKNKQEVGRRLALCARSLVYGEKVEYSGPLFQSARLVNGAMRVVFSHANGVMFKGDTNAPGRGFTLAGLDGKWVWADSAKIDGDAVIVSAASIPNPVAVRYAWADNPPVTLFNGAGLPASPFRSDGDKSETGMQGERGEAAPPASAEAEKRIAWNEALKQTDAWYGSSEAARIADNVLLYQHDNGGWIKNTDMAAPLSLEERARVQKEKSDATESTIDNQSTYPQIAYLARVNLARPNPAYQAAVVKGLDYLLAAQYANGGWPQYFPLRKGYYTHITFNDDAMIGVMKLLRDVGENDPAYRFLDATHKEKSRQAVQRGIDCILKTQIIVNGKKTGWCQQHDEKTFAPAPARKFEPIALTTNETVPIVEFLMDTSKPTDAIKAAIEGAVVWLKTAQVNGIRYARKPAPGTPKGYDMVVEPDPNAPPIWSRMVEIGTNKPLFMGRDSVPKYKVSEIEYERRVGYQWYGMRPAKLIDQEYPAWKARVAAASSAAP